MVRGPNFREGKHVAPIRLFELAYCCRLYRDLTKFDASIELFRRKTTPTLDLQDSKHRKALLEWLRSWGCRQFALANDESASGQLVEWYGLWQSSLPPTAATLVQLSEEDLEEYSSAYEDISTRTAGLRHYGSREVPVRFGPTGAAKILHALRPDAFPPWDEPIRARLGYDESVESYRRFLCNVRDKLRELIEEAGGQGISATEIPLAVGRPNSSLPKLIDEYYWIRITRGLSPPDERELEQWWRWAQKGLHKVS